MRQLHAFRTVTQVLLVFLASYLIEVAHANDVNIVSNSSWSVTDANGQPLGNSQNVCLNAGFPVNCPTTAVVYGYPYGVWRADTSTIPGATWIWAPNITGSSTPAASAEFTFQTQFYLCGAPTGGNISLAADNSAEVLLNGISVATSSDHTVLSSFPIPVSRLSMGLNIIQVKVKNDLNPADCGSGEYRCNPAGVLLGASFADALTALPQCPGNNGIKFTVGQSEALNCPPGKTGSASRPCLCAGNLGFWGSTNDSACFLPPKTCTGLSTTFMPGQLEQLSCPVGQSGINTRTCQTDGTWRNTSNTCALPPKTCAGTSASFAVGQSETLSCPSGQVGSQSRTCNADGNWDATINSCVRPTAAVGEQCGARDLNPPEFKLCPTGTSCGPRLLPTRPRPWYCVVFGIDCPVRLQTTDWFCDPPTP
jgi:hypothetical protein